MRGLGDVAVGLASLEEGGFRGVPHSSCQQPSRQTSRRKLGVTGDRVLGLPAPRTPGRVALKGWHCPRRLHGAPMPLNPGPRFTSQDRLPGTQEASCSLRGRPPPALCVRRPLRRSLEGKVRLSSDPPPRAEPGPTGLAPRHVGPAWMGRKGSLCEMWGRPPAMVPGTEGGNARGSTCNSQEPPSLHDPRARQGCREGRRGQPCRATWTGDRGRGTGAGGGAPPGAP